jgi:hypothetical protein
MSARVYEPDYGYSDPAVIWAPPTTGNSLARVFAYQYGVQMEKAIFPSEQFTVEEVIDDGLAALMVSRSLGNMGAFEHGKPGNRVLVTHFIARRLTRTEADGDAGVAGATISIRPYSGVVAGPELRMGDGDTDLTIAASTMGPKFVSAIPVAKAGSIDVLTVVCARSAARIFSDRFPSPPPPPQRPKIGVLGL